MTLEVFVPGEPKGQPRPRAFALHGKARVYTPGSAEAWKSQIAHACREWRDAGIAGPVSVSLTFEFARPKSHYTSAGELRGSAPAWHVSKPDTDNLAKAVLDTLTTIGVWHDDAQVIELLLAKRYAPHGGCHISILEDVA